MNSEEAGIPTQDARAACVELLAAFAHLIEVPAATYASAADAIAAGAPVAGVGSPDGRGKSTVVVDDLLTLTQHGVDYRRIAAAVEGRASAPDR